MGSAAQGAHAAISASTNSPRGARLALRQNLHTYQLAYETEVQTLIGS